MSDDATPIRKPAIIAVVGGLVDESRVTLAIYGVDLDPDEVSATLGSAPTSAHRAGDRRRATSMPFASGAWLLTVEGKSPEGPDELIRRLLDRFSLKPEIWIKLRERYQVGIRVGIHTAGWNRGFELSAASLAAVHRVGGTLGFDLYFYGDESGDDIDPSDAADETPWQ